MTGRISDYIKSLILTDNSFVHGIHNLRTEEYRNYK